MGNLPIPAKLFFQDFSFDLIEYEIFDGSTSIGVFKGLTNSDEHGRYIGFLCEDSLHIQVGYTLVCTHNNYCISSIDYDYYNGKAELLKAYY